MAGIFDPENDFWRTVSAVGDTLGLSILWLFCCLPIVTIGPATAALYFSVTKYVRPMHPGAFMGFFHSFRQNFKVGLISTLLLIPLSVIIFWVEIGGGVSNAGAGALTVAGHVVTVILAGMAAYVFPVLGRFEHTVGSLFKTSASLAVAHLPTTIILALLVLETILLCIKYLWPLVFLPAVAAVLVSLLLERVFRKHMPTQEGSSGDSAEALQEDDE